MFYARARTNSIKLEEHKGRGIADYNKTCRLCNEETEDIVHFLTRCSKLEEKRNYDLLDRNIIDSEERMRILLFRNKNCYEVGKMIKRTLNLEKETIEDRARQKKKPDRH